MRHQGALAAPHVAHAVDPLRDRPEPGFDVIPAVLEPADTRLRRRRQMLDLGLQTTSASSEKPDADDVASVSEITDARPHTLHRGAKLHDARPRIRSVHARQAAILWSLPGAAPDATALSGVEHWL